MIAIWAISKIWSNPSCCNFLLCFGHFNFLIFFEILESDKYEKCFQMLRALFMTSNHQFVLLKPRIFFHKILCYDFFNDAVKCILEKPSRFRKGRLIWVQSFSRKQKINKYLLKNFVDWWIGGLMLRTRYFCGIPWQHKPTVRCLLPVSWFVQKVEGFSFHYEIHYECGVLKREK